MLGRQSQQYVYWLLSTVIVVLLLPFFYSMTMLFPDADDLLRAVLANGLFDVPGGLAEMHRAWMEHSGRFTHHFLVVFLGDAAMSRTAYSVVCMGGLGITAAALYSIFSTLSSPGSKTIPLFLTLFCLLTIQCAHTAYHYTFTLLTDVLGITLGNSLVLVQISFLCRLWFCTSKRGVVVFTSLAILSAFLGSGCYEHAALASGAVSAAALLLALLYRHPNWRAYAAVLASTLTAMALSFLAPGNFARRGDDFDTPLLSTAFGEWLQGGLGMFSPAWVAMALTVACLLQPRWKEGLDDRLGPVSTLTAGILGISLLSFSICLMHTVANYSLSSASKLGASISVLGAYALVFLMLSMRHSLQRLHVDRLGLVIAVATLGTLCLSSNMANILGNVLGGNLKNHALMLTQQLDILRQNKDRDATVAAVEYFPFPIFPMGSPTDPNDGRNLHMASLYENRSVRRLVSSGNYAYRAAQQTPPLPFTSAPLPAPVKSCTVFLNVKGSDADNSRKDWLLIRMSHELFFIDTVVVEEPSKHRLIPSFIQERLATHYTGLESADFSLLTRITGLSKTIWTGGGWQVTTDGPDYVYMLPLRVSEDTPIRAIFAGWGGKVWRVF